MRARPASCAGFTLIEVLVVVAILAATASLAAPLLRGPPRAALLRAETTRFVAALRITRSAAMLGDGPMLLSIDPTNGTFGSAAVPLATLDPRLALEVAATPGADATQTIAFFPSGRSSGATVRLRLETLSARVRVVWATGAVLVDEAGS